LLHAVGRGGGQMYRRTDRHDIVNCRFCSFANAPNKEQVVCRVPVGTCLGTHMGRIIDNTSIVQYVGSNVCEYKCARRTRGNNI
jgi:hypothetical protein